MIIIEALAWGRDQIKATAHEKVTHDHNPQLDAQALLSGVLKCNSAFLMAHGNDQLSTEAWETFSRYITRRAKHEPVSQILQSVHFYGREFFVNNFVLTPRPETETLIDVALQSKNSTEVYFDIGTGSGAIAITLAKETTKPVIALDIDKQALEVARQNAKNLGADIKFIESDLLKALKPEDFTGLRVTIVANLPYIPVKEKVHIDPDVLLYEPSHALFSGPDGLNHYDDLLRSLKNWPMVKQLFFEIDATQSLLFAALQKTYLPNWQMSIEKDLAGRDRFVILKSK